MNNISHEIVSDIMDSSFSQQKIKLIWKNNQSNENFVQ